MKNITKLAAMVLFAAAVLTSCKKDVIYYTVTFDGNGGQISGDSVINVAEGGKFINLVPYIEVPENNIFNGWYKDAGLTELWDFDNDIVTGDITLYAGWTPLRTFTFYGNGGIFYDNRGSEIITVDRLTDGDQLPIPGNLIKPGYLLEGWYKDAGLTELWDFANDTVTGDGAIYAKWSATEIDGLMLENYPMVDGATSTRALNVMIACKLLGLPYYWDMMNNTGEMYVVPKGEYGPYLVRHIRTSQTHIAMMNLISGDADIILRSTTASPDEKTAAAAAGVTLIETPIALDAFVFLKNRANPVQSLTIEQIRKIYTKQITNWSQVGGNNAPMTVYTRPSNSGSEEAFRELVMKDLEPAEFPEEQQIHAMFGLMWEMAREVNGIGYIFKNYKEMIMGRGEPTFAVNGILPNETTIKNRTYPLTTEIYAIIRTNLDRNSTAYNLYEWLQTESAAMVLEECGFLPY